MPRKATNRTSPATSPFDRIRRVDEHGGEYWSARDLAKLLDYARWENFTTAVEKAKVACQNSENRIAVHFREATKVIRAGKGAKHVVTDWHLTRHACYLIAQNADPSKKNVAEAQTYFAVQTRRAEIADAATFIEMDEGQRRVEAREQVRASNKHLVAVAHACGVTDHQDYAIFQDCGYLGLYGGLRARAIAARKGLTKSQRILDFMGSPELAANLFRITQTSEKLQRDRVQEKTHANHTHLTVGREIRATISRLGGTMPESLPTPAESIDELKRKQRHLTAGLRQTPPALPAPKRQSKRSR